MNNPKRIFIPLGMIVLTVMLVFLINQNPPQNARSKGKAQAQMVVDTITLKKAPFQITINSFGVVKPRTQSKLVAQVSGQISYINARFREGGFFEKGDVLLKIDERDYQAEVKIARASLLNAQQGLLEEQARAEQALLDWQRLGNGNKANALVLREPQLAAQQANVLSAQAQLEKAELALERTKVIAPFAGRVLNKSVDLGQVVSANVQLAEIYASDYVEVRLPINNRDLAFIDLPEQYREGEVLEDANQVTLSSDLIGNQFWQGKLVRTEGAISTQSQQLYVVAQIDDPYQLNEKNHLPIKIGQYVNAQIAGRTLSDVLSIPNSAIYQGSYVYIVDESNALLRKEVDILWQGKTSSIIGKHLSSGMKLVVTPLGQVSSGTLVRTLEQSNKQHTPKGEKLEGQARSAKRGEQ